MRVVTGAVKHGLMSVREITLQYSTAASLALFDPAGSYLYIPALRMNEITGLAECVCVCEERNHRPCE